MMNQQLNHESEAQERPEEPVPIPSAESELAERIKSLVGDESQAAFARRSGVGESLLRQYFAGTEPSASRLVRLADAANVSIEWLATGRGPKDRAAGAAQLDHGRLALAIASVQRGLDGTGAKVAPEAFAELVASFYRTLGPAPAGPPPERAGQVVTGSGNVVVGRDTVRVARQVHHHAPDPAKRTKPR